MERHERAGSIEPAGVMAMACTHRRPDATRGLPVVDYFRIVRQPPEGLDLH